MDGTENNWEKILGGDGFRVLVDPVNNNYLYAESQRGNLLRSENGGADFIYALSGVEGQDRKNWNSPLAFDPQNTSTLYFGTQKVYKSTNRAASWTSISPDLSLSLIHI